MIQLFVMMFEDSFFLFLITVIVQVQVSIVLSNCEKSVSKKYKLDSISKSSELKYF